MEKYLEMLVHSIWSLNVDKIRVVAQEMKEIKPEMIAPGGYDGATVWLIGNGGSAATASHIANDLVKIGGVKARDVGGMTALVTAVANDIGYEETFAYPIQTLARKNHDMLLAISCSGESENVYRALIAAKTRMWMYTVLLTQNEGGKCAEVADSVISVYTSDIRIAEDLHLVIGHMIAGELRGSNE